MPRPATGIRQRHGRRCAGGRCACPWEAFVYSKRDGKKIRKAFPTKAAAWVGATMRRVARAANVRWSRQSAVTIVQAAEAWLQGARAGLIRTRSGDEYKPSAIRAYERRYGCG